MLRLVGILHVFGEKQKNLASFCPQGQECDYGSSFKACQDALQWTENVNMPVELVARIV